MRGCSTGECSEVKLRRISRRELLENSAKGAAVLALGVRARSAMGETEERAAGTLPGRAAFTPLRLGELKPAGWLERQLRIQADGMGGHLDEFWPDVGPNSAWKGGTGEAWERGPYFVDGLFPLAVLLDDAKLRAKAMRFIDWTLDNQQANGMLGPASNDDWWPRMVMVKVLAQFYDATGDARVLPALTRYFHHQLEAMPARPLRDWGKYRWQDEALVVAWLYERTGDPKLPELAALLQRQGYDWVAGFANFKYTEPCTRAYLGMEGSGTENNAAGMQTHGVNNGQAIKTAAVRYLLTGGAEERGHLFHQLEMLDRYHGMPSGIFSCDEHLAGLDQVHGTELCTVVETLFSLEVSLAAFGDAALADRIEKIAYNALPGTFTDDMWSHQYDQQPNQVEVGLHSKPWTTNGTESNLYGLEPNFGCCTANFHQGWPKLAAHLWMRSPDGGLAAMIYAPCELRTEVPAGVVRLAVETEYPFRETVRVRVKQAPGAAFPLRMRIPAWAASATLQVNGASVNADTAPGGFARIERVWKAGDVLELRLPMQPVVTAGYRDAVSVSRGPLVFSLSPGESWVKLQDRGPTADWQVFPRGSWNYALAVQPGPAANSIRVEETAVGARPFSADGCGVRLHVRGRQLPHWRSEDGVAQTVPEGPQKSAAPETGLALVPYAAAKLRVTSFPRLA